MNTLKTAALCCALFASIRPAFAVNELVLLSNDSFANSTALAIGGSGNTLRIVQEHFGGGAGNSVAVTIDGSFNGGPAGAAFSPIAQANGLNPGTLMQSGFDNHMRFDVAGSHNLFAAAQFGSSNVIEATISGSYNQASIMQVGTGNFATFSQTGIGNTVSISQTSW